MKVNDVPGRKPKTVKDIPTREPFGPDHNGLCPLFCGEPIGQENDGLV